MRQLILSVLAISAVTLSTGCERKEHTERREIQPTEAETHVPVDRDQVETPR